MKSYTIPSKNVPVCASADVIIAGGGPAGVGAAIQAAKQGAKVLLIERFGSCGGIITNGFMSISGPPKTELLKEMYRRLETGGHITNISERFPKINTSYLTHYSNRNLGRPEDAKENIHYAFDPNMLSCVMNDLFEEHNVQVMYRSLITGAVVEHDTVAALIVENASGIQAVEGKVFIDATGRGDVLARAGAPFMSAGEGKMPPMPSGLMWKMNDVDVDAVFEYEEKEDPGLDKVTRKAMDNGELPYYRSEKERADREYEDRIYSGHPRLEMAPGAYPGEVIFWAPIVYEWGLNPAENAEDLTKAEIQIRKEIVSEMRFVQKNVPGFEKARMGGIAPFLGIREGRRTLGEYMLTYQDVRENRRFEDVALRKHNELLHFEIPNSAPVDYLVEYPYRSFQAKKVDNLLVCGDLVSMEHAVFLYNRNFNSATIFGEVAGTAAGLSIKNSISPKKLKWGPIVIE